MSTNESRLSSCVRRSTLQVPYSSGGFQGVFGAVVRHAAVSVRRFRLSWIACWAGGEADERSRAAVGAGRVRSAPPEPGCGPRPVVRHECGVLPGLGQGAGQVRDAARASGRPAGDGRAARRTARAPRAGQIDTRDRGVHPFGCARLRRPGRRAGGRPVRSAAAPANRRTGPRQVTARSFWSPAEASQVDYETLRAHLLEHGRLPDGLAAARFARRGVAGLIAWPSAEPVFVAELLGAARPAWTPHADPRMSALAAGYQFLLDTDVQAPPFCAVRGGAR